jgi:hypothetical protein
LAPSRRRRGYGGEYIFLARNSINQRLKITKERLVTENFLFASLYAISIKQNYNPEGKELTNL